MDDAGRRAKDGSKFPSIVNGLGFLDMVETSLSCEEEEMAELTWCLRRMTGEGRIWPNKMDGLPAQLPLEGVRYSVQTVRFALTCSLWTHACDFSQAPYVHVLVVNSCPSHSFSSDQLAGSGSCVESAYFTQPVGNRSPFLSFIHYLRQQLNGSLCFADEIWSEWTLNDDDPIKGTIRNTCCSWQKNLVAEARTEMLPAKVFLLIHAGWCLSNKGRIFFCLLEGNLQYIHTW